MSDTSLHTLNGPSMHAAKKGQRGPMMTLLRKPLPALTGDGQIGIFWIVEQPVSVSLVLPGSQRHSTYSSLIFAESTQLAKSSFVVILAGAPKHAIDVT